MSVDVLALASLQAHVDSLLLARDPVALLLLEVR